MPHFKCPKCNEGFYIPHWFIPTAIDPRANVSNTAIPVPPPVREVNEKPPEVKETSKSSLPHQDQERAQMQLAGTLGFLCDVTAALDYKMDAINNDDLWGLFSLLNDLQIIAFSSKQ